MSDEKYIDVRTLRTCEAIEDALKNMVCEMSANEITVKRITERVHINRKTFYLHYRCIEDLFHKVCDEICDGYAKKRNALNSKEGSGLNPEEDARRYYRTFFEYFTSLEPYAERLLCEPSYAAWADYIIQTCAASNRRWEKNMLDLTETERLLFHSPFVASMVDVYRQWVRLGKNLPVDDLVSYSFKVLYHGMSQLLAGCAE